MHALVLLLPLFSACISQKAIDAGRDRDHDGYVAVQLGGNDCDDSDAAVHPGAPEVCGNGKDDNCDGVTDDNGLGAKTFYPDLDHDGYATDAPITACSAPPSYLPDLSGGIDCDDTNPAVHPGAQEVCGNGIDDNCDGRIDDSGVNAPAWYPDLDDDGYTGTSTLVACAQPAHYVLVASATPDCNDNDSAIHPGAAEIWYDGIDENCDGADDYDQDGDGYDSAAHTQSGTDCLDTNPDVHPGATEICNNGLDDDCDGTDNGCHLHGTLDAATVATATIDMSGAPFYSQKQLLVADITDDEHPDILVGGYTNDVYLFAGPFAGSTSVGAARAQFTRSSGAWDWSAVGDFDGDGATDVAIGDHYAQEVQVFLGPFQGDYPLASADMVLTDSTTGSSFGKFVLGVPDLDGDHKDELLVGAPGLNTTQPPSMYLFSGPLGDGWTPAQRTADLYGDYDNIDTGMFAIVATLQPGDQTRLIIPTDGDEAGVGSVASFSSTQAAGARSVFDYTIAQGSETGAYAGYRVAAGDLTGDGVTDLAVGAPADTSDTGKVYIVKGPLDVDQQLSLSPTTIAGTTATVGVSAGDQAGSDLAVLDLDGDGKDDLCIGATASAGLVFCFYGPLASGAFTLADADVVFTGTNDTIGFGDLDGDGKDDLVLFGDNTILVIPGRGL